MKVWTITLLVILHIMYFIVLLSHAILGIKIGLLVIIAAVDILILIRYKTVSQLIDKSATRKEATELLAKLFTTQRQLNIEIKQITDMLPVYEGDKFIKAADILLIRRQQLAQISANITEIQILIATKL